MPRRNRTKPKRGRLSKKVRELEILSLRKEFIKAPNNEKNSQATNKNRE